MKKENAVIRTPVEIWRSIFESALEWLELPAEDDVPFKYINFDWYSCKSYHLYSFSLSNRRNLRLVCRSWRQMIDAGHAPCVITYLRKGQDDDQAAFSCRSSLLCAWNFGECISTAAYRRGCFPPCRQGFASTPQYNVESNFYDFTPHSLPGYEHLIQLLPINEQNPQVQSEENELHISISRTKVLFICNNIMATWRQFPSFLKYAKNVRALSWTTKCPNDSSFLGQLTSLTMLHLQIEVGQEKWTTKPLIIPTLRYLRVDFAGRPGVSYVDCSEESMANWKVSNLSVLEVHNYIYSEWGLGQILASFVSRHLDTITGLVFDTSSWPHDDRWCGESSLWTSLNRLSVLGASLNWFSQHAPQLPTPVYPSGKSLDILLYDFLADWKGIEPETEAVERASLLVNWCESFPCSVGLISMDKSWRDVRVWVKNGSDSLVQERLCRANALLEGMTKGGIPFCDRDGIRLPSGDITSFLKGE